MSECNKAAGCLALHNAWIAFRHSLRHKPEAWISFLINSPTQNCMYTNSVTFNVLLKNTEVRVFFFISLYFFLMGPGGERGVGEFLIHGLSFPHLLNTRPSLLRKAKTVTPTHDTKAKLMYQTNIVGVEIFSLTLSFVSILSSIPEWLPQTHSFLKHNFCGFSPLFFIRYRYQQIFFIQGRKR